MSAAFSALEEKVAENAALAEMAKKASGVGVDEGTQRMRKDLWDALHRAYYEVHRGLELVQRDSVRLKREILSDDFGQRHCPAR
jgi:hypothetical protein